MKHVIIKLIFCKIKHFHNALAHAAIYDLMVIMVGPMFDGVKNCVIEYLTCCLDI